MTRSRQQEGGAKIRVTREGHLTVRGEDAHVLGGGGIGGRKDEGSFDVIELGGERLRLRRCQSRGATATGLPPKGSSVNTSAVAQRRCIR